MPQKTIPRPHPAQPRTRAFSLWTAPRPLGITPAPKRAQIAQLVEQRIENPRVGGSIPSLGTT